MQAFACRVCGAPLYFENSVCVSCGTAVGFSREERALVPLDAAGRYVDGDGLIWHVCRNLNLSGCTWLARLEGGQCEACDLTRVRPADSDLEGLANFVPAERAKRHLIVELDRLELPVRSRAADPAEGLAFDLLSSTLQSVTTGHVDGVITIDLAESDAAHREGLREQLAEPYRTLLGHFRHEIGHYYQWQLVRSDAALQRFRELFGDERADYQAAVDRHYAEGAPADWAVAHISTYATMHPHEDFAETWAHLMHILDTVDSAVAYGLVDAAAVGAASTIRDLVVEVWMPLSTALNAVNRSMGKDDLYPFAIPAPVLDKLEFAASLLP
ncbi:zinc-binding metallopeptidase family protein [Microbacterium hominis]|uniref:Putative zinc-binding metallopeptidase n=1 Tax=Microbacterium hominis TaxID=162426 RepID=A0A7D4PSL1_9MICO|nr:putative zinc-binding metallopeptidase [Microbacterium hominis]QKJ18093.1 putative zinc-binding metallopeptidase [Microbacterium hominis]